MSNHFSMGAINKTTNKYEYPKIANKNNKYKCPFCEKDVIFRNGKIKQSHFAHYKSDNPCSYYKKPTETQIHKDAKLLLKTILDNKNKLSFYRECYKCEFQEPTMCNYIISSNDYNETTKAVIEYKFFYNNSNRSADVALTDNNDIKYIFEICYKNKTKEENRPEPWFEINAENLINSVNCNNVNENGEIELECIRRHYRCDYCNGRDNYEFEILKKLQLKEDEQRKEKNELLNMGKEDERTIQNQIEKKLKIEKERAVEEKIKKQIELERYNLWEKKQSEEQAEQEAEKRKQQEIIDRQYESMRKLLGQNNKCSGCNINYCKCDNPNYIKNENNRIMCNSCKKNKCRCIFITDFFKI
jgi:hypothetical protein